MNIIKVLIKNVKLSVMEAIHSKKQDIDLNRPIFSFTFDDAPLSAAIAGAAVLENTDTTGTYYVASDIRLDSAEAEPFIDANGLRALHHRGHDIQCHTFSHLKLGKYDSQIFNPDCRKNRESIASLTGQSRVSHFAYPFGSVSFSAKRILGEAYETMRTSDFGINFGMTDMSHLRAIAIYSNSMDKHRISQAIEESVKNNAWTIFYTHDVKDCPTLWGATPEDLQWVVDKCNETQGELLNIDQAYRRITG